MSAVERIQAAIARLESWRGIKVHPKVEGAIIAQARLGGDMAQSALGLITLTDDAMIDAQLAILRNAVGHFPEFFMSSDVELNWLLKRPSSRDALALANAILGPDPH